MLNFLHWYYVEWIMSNTSWTAIAYLIPKTILLIIAVILVLYIIISFFNGISKLFTKSNKSHDN